jgi:hypothetical protein
MDSLDMIIISTQDKLANLKPTLKTMLATLSEDKMRDFSNISALAAGREHLLFELITSVEKFQGESLLKLVRFFIAAVLRTSYSTGLSTKERREYVHKTIYRLGKTNHLFYTEFVPEKMYIYKNLHDPKIISQQDYEIRKTTGCVWQMRCVLGLLRLIGVCKDFDAELVRPTVEDYMLRFLEVGDTNIRIDPKYHLSKIFVHLEVIRKLCEQQAKVNSTILRNFIDFETMQNYLIFAIDIIEFMVGLLKKIIYTNIVQIFSTEFPEDTSASFSENYKYLSDVYKTDYDMTKNAKFVHVAKTVYLYPDFRTIMGFAPADRINPNSKCIDFDDYSRHQCNALSMSISDVVLYDINITKIMTKNVEFFMTPERERLMMNAGYLVPSPEKGAQTQYTLRFYFYSQLVLYESFYNVITILVQDITMQNDLIAGTGHLISAAEILDTTCSKFDKVIKRSLVLEQYMDILRSLVGKFFSYPERRIVMGTFAKITDFMNTIMLYYASIAKYVNTDKDGNFYPTNEFRSPTTVVESV